MWGNSLCLERRWPCRARWVAAPVDLGREGVHAVLYECPDDATRRPSGSGQDVRNPRPRPGANASFEEPFTRQLAEAEGEHSVRQSFVPRSDVGESRLAERVHVAQDRQGPLLSEHAGTGGDGEGLQVQRESHERHAAATRAAEDKPSLTVRSDVRLSIVRAFSVM